MWELTAVPRSDRICGVTSLGRMILTLRLPEAASIGKMKSSWPMPLTTRASRSASLWMSSGRGW